jgi:hypothetical protein
LVEARLREQIAGEIEAMTASRRGDQTFGRTRWRDAVSGRSDRAEAVVTTAADVKQIDLQAEIASVATYGAIKYEGFAERDDFLQELHLYALTGGAKHLAKWAGTDEQFRIRRALHGVVKQYGEEQKALALGYSYGDVAWYTADKLADLVPLALDAGWDGLTGEQGDGERQVKSDGREGGTLLAMVADVRRVLGSGPHMPADYDPETEVGKGRLQALSELLGGDPPDAPGYRRRAMSNSQAQAKTREYE